MTDQSTSVTTPKGLLTPSERKRLQEGDPSSEMRDELLERARERLEATLADIRLLYPTLRVLDIESVFTADDDRDLADIRVATQDALALLVFGMLENDDDLEWRVSEAIRNATLDYGEDVSVDLDVRRGPFPTLEHCLDRFERDGMTPENLALFERLLFQSDAHEEQLAAAAERLGIEATPTQVEELLEKTPFQRLPQTTVVSVEVDPNPDINPESDHEDQT